jgi:hypothetical protein
MKKNIIRVSYSQDGGGASGAKKYDLDLLWTTISMSNR